MLCQVFDELCHDEQGTVGPRYFWYTQLATCFDCTFGLPPVFYLGVMVQLKAADIAILVPFYRDWS